MFNGIGLDYFSIIRFQQYAFIIIQIHMFRPEEFELELMLISLNFEPIQPFCTFGYNRGAGVQRAVRVVLGRSSSLPVLRMKRNENELRTRQGQLQDENGTV